MGRFSRRRNRITSDDGFVVEITGGRGGLRYSEGERAVEVDSEFWGGKPRGVTIFAGSIKTWSGSGGPMPVSRLEAERILQNIVAAFAFDGYSAEVTWVYAGEPG
jgi:hypothetical protein